MTFTRSSIPDVVIIDPSLHGDDRGYFVETFHAEKLESFLGYRIPFCQDNESKSVYGVLRGLHYQLPPFAQTKLVRVIEGEVLDITVDIRKGSPTFGQHVALRLSGENKRQVLIPRGFAHGFVVLSDSCTFAYKVDNYYSPEYDRGVAYDDPALNINWILEKSELQLSPKDIRQPLLSAADLFDYGTDFYPLKGTGA